MKIITAFASTSASIIFCTSSLPEPFVFALKSSWLSSAEAAKPATRDAGKGAEVGRRAGRRQRGRRGCVRDGRDSVRALGRRRDGVERARRATRLDCELMSVVRDERRDVRRGAASRLLFGERLLSSLFVNSIPDVL